MPSPELVWGLATEALDSSGVVDRVTLVWPQLSEVDQTSAETNVSRLAPMPHCISPHCHQQGSKHGGLDLTSWRTEQGRSWLDPSPTLSQTRLGSCPIPLLGSIPQHWPAALLLENLFFFVINMEGFPPSGSLRCIPGQGARTLTWSRWASNWSARWSHPLLVWRTVVATSEGY